MSDRGFEEFEPLLAAHVDFAEALLEHQAALVSGDVSAGVARIEALRDALHAHSAFEDAELLPLLEQAGGWSRIGDPRFYRKEHVKIRGLLAGIVAATQGLDRDHPGFHRAVALLIGREQTLRTLLEHHDDRERQALYLDLVRITTPEQRAALVARAPGL